MAGSGRRSHYRKHLTDAVLHDLPEPDETIGQRIARIVGSRGYDKFIFFHGFYYDAQIIGVLNTSNFSHSGNMFDVIVAPISGSKDKVGVQQKDEDATISSENANEKNDKRR